MPDEDHDWLLTLGMIGLYRAGVGAMLPMLREAAGGADLAAAVAEGRFPRRGKVRRHFDYRVRGDHLIVTFNKFRIEFNFKYPEAFSAYLLQRHIDLNRILRRSFPQYIGLPLTRELTKLSERKLVELVDDTA